jgi:glycosyltransferase involved in cell wall biosynthesis
MEIKYSVVVPAKDEEGNIERLYAALRPVLEGLGKDFEIILIDDGSGDGTWPEMQRVREGDARVKLIRFRRSFGQTAAWSAGFDKAAGEYVIVMDADLQNDPEDIPALLTKMREDNLDVVSGWRKERKDKGHMMWLSRMGNAFHRWVTGEKINDHGCSLKVYKREALRDLELYGEMHRYITALLSWKGFRVGELPVRHHPRDKGQTKYSIRKKLKGFLDLLVVKFWIQYSARPMHFFGAIGMFFVAVGLILGGALGTLWLFRVIGLAGRSSPLLAVLLVIVGVQFLLTGVLADVVSHTYYAAKKAYSIKERVGFGS